MRVGIAFAEQPFTVPEVIAASQRAESLGFESVWMAQDLWTRRDGLTFLSCIAAATRRVFVGSSLLNPYLHHPFQIAMILNTLSDLAPDRLRLGIGSGLPFWQPLFPEQVKSRPPLLAVRETVEVVRRLLEGEVLDYAGESLSLTLTRPCYPRALPPLRSQVPIYVGAKGPKMTQLAGEIGDGLLLGASTRLDELDRQMGDVARGASRAGRSAENVDVASIIVTSVSRDGQIDANTLGAIAARMSRLSPEETLQLDLDPELVARVRGAYEQNDCAAAGGLITREVASRWAAVGTVEQCIETVAQQRERGVALPILFTFACGLTELLELGAALVTAAD